jgi:hypothetical protein
MSEAAYFPESWPLIFDFLTFLLDFMLDPDQIQFRNRIRSAFGFRFRQCKKLQFLRFRYQPLRQTRRDNTSTRASFGGVSIK